MNRATGPALVALSLLAVALGGCGETGGTSTQQQGSEATAPLSKQAETLSPAEAKVATTVGRKACRGLTPLQAAKRYAPAARRAGATKRFVALIADPSPKTKSSPGYPRLVAALYALTLPAPRRAEVAAGCAKELASTGSGGQASP